MQNASNIPGSKFEIEAKAPKGFEGIREDLTAILKDLRVEDSETSREAEKRGINSKQWRTLLHLVGTKELIDRDFKFPGGGIIEYDYDLGGKGVSDMIVELPDNLHVLGSLQLGRDYFLQSLPEGLKVGGQLNIFACNLLTSLPPDLEVGGDIYLGEKLNDQVKKDARRLKEEGKIKGDIRGI